MRILLPMLQGLAAFVPLQLEQASAQTPTVSEHRERTRQFHIAAGDAQDTLTEFSTQSGLQLLYDFNTVLGIKTREINGEMEPAVALTRMIDGTGLTFEFVNGGTVAIMPVRGPVGSGAQKRGDAPHR